MVNLTAILLIYSSNSQNLFFLTDPFWRRKITTDPHILAHVNTEHPNDSYEYIPAPYVRMHRMI